MGSGIIALPPAASTPERLLPPQAPTTITPTTTALRQALSTVMPVV
jgi:hypothetical protein